MGGWIEMYSRLRTSLGKPGAMVVMLGLIVMVAILPGVWLFSVGRWIPPKRPPPIAVLDICQPSNLQELRRLGSYTCEDHNNRTSAVFKLPKDLAIVFNIPPGTSFHGMFLRTLVFLKSSGSAMVIAVKDVQQNELKLEVAFDDVRSTGMYGDIDSGTGSPKLLWCGQDNSCQPFPFFASWVFPGYRIFSTPDFLSLEAAFDGSSMKLGQRLFQSWADHSFEEGIDDWSGVHVEHGSQPVALGEITSIRIQASSPGFLRGRLDRLESLTGQKLRETPALPLRGSVKLPRGVKPENVLVHIEPYASKGIGREVSIVRVLSDGSFAVEFLPAGEYELWAEGRDAEGRLYTGSCAAGWDQIRTNPWATFHPRSRIPRAVRSDLALCKSGTITLIKSPEQDRLRIPHADGPRRRPH